MHAIVGATLRTSIDPGLPFHVQALAGVDAR
jgi:hypothetical protein